MGISGEEPALCWGAGLGQRSTTGFPHHVQCSPGDLAAKADKIYFTLMPDTFLHMQHLRKQGVSAFCSESSKAAVPPTGGRRKPFYSQGRGMAAACGGEIKWEAPGSSE